ncbi:hydrogenase nickel incorporation protein HypB [Nonomuraea sp. NPDC050643]|uniref:hydrogenase nickel incorporation protein HypB n=1 Tax=Nonomuraea sp. NPDC050643 TaxID=3155660 RepID=UPI003407987A
MAGGQPATPGQAAAHGQAPHPGQAVAAHGRTLTIEQRVLARNDALAERNRAWLAGRGVLALNLMSSPGSGKTTLLERTIRDLGDRLPVAVIEGDQETAFDADRIRATGCQAVQVNTGSGCHLDAAMLSGALDRLRLTPGSVVFVENVGNLVCPALFDLGEARRVVITSVTEGADKPVKYPHMFRTADLVLLNKIDLLPYVGFSCEEFRARLRQVNPAAPVVTTSATRGDGVPEWLAWLREQTGEDGFP